MSDRISVNIFMANHHNITQDTLPHVNEKRNLSGAYGKKAHMGTEKAVEQRRQAVAACLGVQNGIYENRINLCYPVKESIRSGKVTWTQLGITPKEFVQAEKAYDLIVCKNQLQVLREGEYDGSKSWPWRGIEWYIQEGKVTWEDLETTADEIYLLAAKKWVADIQNGVHDVRHIFPHSYIIDFVRAGKVSWENLGTTQKELNVLIARRWVTEIRKGEYDGNANHPDLLLFMYIEAGRVTWEELGVDEKELTRTIARKLVSDIRNGARDNRRYSPYKDILMYIQKGRITLEGIGITEKELNSLVAEKMPAEDINAWKNVLEDSSVTEPEVQ